MNPIVLEVVSWWYCIVQITFNVLLSTELSRPDIDKPVRPTTSQATCSIKLTSSSICTLVHQHFQKL
ncbi:hypothetical protein YC2023_122403 [Brassica napus]